MTIEVFALLVGACGYLATRLHTAKAENSALRATNALLKRRLDQRPIWNLVRLRTDYRRRA